MRSIRLRRDAIVRMLRLTDAFIWEDLPTRDPVTGYRTFASWIPRIQKFAFIFTTTVVGIHVVQSTIRLFISDDRPFVYGTWYPFNATNSPAYELVTITQVKASVIRWVCSFVLYIMWSEHIVNLQNSDMHTYDGIAVTQCWGDFVMRTVLMWHASYVGHKFGHGYTFGLL